VIPAGLLEDGVMVALATLHPKALDRHALYESVLFAAGAALAQAFSQEV